MIRVILYCIFVIALSLGVAWVLDNNAPLSWRWLGYQFDTSIAFILFITVTSIVLGTALLQIFLWLTSLPKRYSQRRDLYHYQQGLEHLTQGFAAIAAKDARAAKSQAKRVVRYLGKQPLATLLQAQIAQLEGNSEGAQRHFQTLLEQPSTMFVGLKGLLGEARHRGDFRKAISLAETIYQKQPSLEGLAPALLELYKHESQWEKALELLEKKSNRNSWRYAFATKDLLAQEKGVLHYMRAREFYEKEWWDAAYERAEKALDFYPKFSPAILLLAELSITLNRPGKAEKLLKQAWNYQPLPRLGELYLRLHRDNPAEKQLHYAEKLARAHPNHPQSHLLMAQAALNASDAAVAREHLTTVIKDAETKTVCALMARLEEISSNPDPIAIQQWQAKAAYAAPDPHWECGTCQHPSEQWEVRCSHCGSTAGYVWNDTYSKRKTQALASKTNPALALVESE